jgi:nucleotide-binding universal stress UspA family protein
VATTGEDQHRARIVVGLDGSDASTRALECASRQALLTGASLEVVIAWEYPASFGWSPPFPDDYDPAGDAKRAAEQEIAEVLGAERARDVTVSVVEGNAALELIRAAEGATMLVVGSRGHGGFTGLLLGSVSSHCAAHAPCPVLVVR